MMALGKSCRLRASSLVNLFDLAYAAPARVCIAFHENCSEMHWTRAACCMQPCLLTCCLHWTDGLVLGGSFGLGSNAVVCADSTPSPSPRVGGATQWAAQSGRRGVSSCIEEDSLQVGLDAMYGWPERMGARCGC